MIDELQGKVALVTRGGSPSGIGMACASAFVRERASVAITSTTDRIHQRSKDLAGVAYLLVADLVDRQQMSALVEDVMDRFGRVDVLANNAGRRT